MATLGKMTQEVKQELAMKLKSLKQIKIDGGKHTMLKKKPSYANYIAMQGTGHKNAEQIEHFFATYAYGFVVKGLGVLELVLHDKVLKWIIMGKEVVLVCGGMSGDQMQVSVKNWIDDTFEGVEVGDASWPVTEDDPPHDSGGEGEVNEQISLHTFAEMEAMVTVAVGDGVLDSNNLSGDHDFYDVVTGTSSGSLYVVVGLGKNSSSNIAIRYSGTTLSLRCDPHPTDADAQEKLKLLGFTSSNGSHSSCHLSIMEGDPMKRYFILMKAALAGIFDFCDVDLVKVKNKGK